MRIIDFLSPPLVKVHLRSETKEELFEEMVQLLVDAGKIKDRAAALDAVRAREAKMSTGVNRWLAIPHASLPEVKGLVLAMGVSDAGIEYESLDGLPVHVVFLVISEAKNPGPNIQALAEICRLFSKASVRERIRSAQSADEILEIIRQEE